MSAESAEYSMQASNAEISVQSVGDSVAASHFSVSSGSTSPQSLNSLNSLSKQKFSSKKSTDYLTYSWKDINVWTGPIPTPAEQFSAAAAGDDVDVEKSRNYCGRVKQPSKQLLKNVTGIVRPGELLAIMGASGAGKTSLLNVLNFRNTKKLEVTGQRCINGIAIGPDTFTSLSAYIQQNDLFIGSLSVKEHLTFQALVRMDSNIPYKRKMLRVEEVINEFGLSKCSTTRIGYTDGRLKGISGGEMKRLSFASEILTDPKLLFCDEPTSGLDAYMAENVVNSLQHLASLGKTIVCTIHQPSSQVFSLFDRLLLLAEGRVAFLGNATDAIKFFAENGYVCPSNFNPADFYIQTLAIQPGKELESKLKVNRICDNFENGPGGAEIKRRIDAIKIDKETQDALSQTEETSKVSPYKISWCKQFNALLWRSWLTYIKDPFILQLRILQTILISLLIGGMFYGQENDQDGVQNRNGAIYIILLSMSMGNVFGVIDEFCLELPVFLREHFNGMYRTDVYFLTKLIAEAPLFCFIPILYISINYFMIGFNNTPDSFLKFILVLIGVSQYSVSLGYFLSCITGSISISIALGPALIIPLMLFSGFLLNVGSLPKGLLWLKYLSVYFYSYESLAIAQWGTIKNITCDPPPKPCLWSNGQSVLEMLAFEADNFWFDISMLVALIYGTRLLAFLALLSKTLRK